MKKFIFYFFVFIISILSIVLITNIIRNNIQEEISKLKEEQSKDLVLKSFKTQAKNTNFNYLDVQRPDFVEIAKKSINTVVHVKSSSSAGDYSIEDFIFGRSVCTSCNEPLSYLDLIPVVSWIILNGRCSLFGVTFNLVVKSRSSRARINW